MNNKPFLIVILLFLLSIGTTLWPTENEHRLQVELWGGFSLLNPADLNLMAGYYDGYRNFIYDQQYDFLQNAYPDYFSYTVDRSAESSLQKIKYGFPFGMRLTYALSRSLGISLGLQYIGQSRLSSSTTLYQIEDSSLGLLQTTPQQVEVRYPDFFLSVSAWIPQIGIHLARPLGKKLQVGGYLTVGPLLAGCHSVVETQYRSVYVNGYWTERYYLLEMKGNGIGLALDLGARLDFDLNRRWALFLEAGYAWRRTGEISGSGRNQSLYRDSNSTQDLVEQSWEGVWRTMDAYFLRNWGEWRASYYGNYFSDSAETGRFILDLSGFQIKTGLSFKF